MADEPDAARMRDLEERIARAKQAQAPKPRSQDMHARGEIAWRMIIELVAGLVIGFGIGYGLDVLFGTMPIFLVLFVLLGFAAGVNVMLRTAKELQVDDLGSALPDEDDEGN